MSIYVPANTSSIATLLETTTITRPSKLNGYTPKNNKLFCYPFSYLYVTNNTGINTEFRYEDFASATPKFFMAGALGQGCTTKLCPVSYKGYTANSEVFEYGVIGAKYPVCAWASDYYTNWVTQNALNSKAHPDQAHGNTNSSDIMIGWQRYFTIDCMSVRAEVAQSIDEYLTMFGYKVNRVKTPNITGRRNWNYVKTVGCYIEADIPQEDLQTIKTMFDNGVTFWHNASTFADYSQNNDII